MWKGFDYDPGDLGIEFESCTCLVIDARIWHSMDWALVLSGGRLGWVNCLWLNAP
jgi:hypothetical protein